MIISHNLSADWASRNLRSTQALMQTSLARLSSGSKLTQASDDAAGGAVSTRLDAQSVQVEAVRNTITNALSFTQTQSGYIKNATKLLNRMGELCLLAQDVTKSAEDRAIYDREYVQVCEAWRDLSAKEFNGRRLFSHVDREVLTDTDGTTFKMAGIDLMGMDYMEVTSPLTPRLNPGFFTIDGESVDASPAWPSPRSGLDAAASVLGTDWFNQGTYHTATGKDTFSLESGRVFLASGENDTSNCLALMGLNKGSYYARTSAPVGWDSTSPVAAAGVKAGDFEVDGVKVTVAAEDTIQGVLDKIYSATGGAVQAVWQNTGDGGGNVLFKSAHAPIMTDGTSKFLAQFGLLADGTHHHTITSGGLAAWSKSTPLTAADISAGDCTVNGVPITIGATDTFEDLINKINTASGGKITAKWVESADGGGHLRLEAAADSDVSVSDNGSNVFTKLGLGGAGTTHHLANSGLLAGWKAETTMSEAGVKSGSFQVNGKTVSVSATDTVQEVLTKIGTATSGAVNATWHSSGTSGGEVHLNSTSTPVLSTPSGEGGSDFLAKIGLDGAGNGTNLFSMDGTYVGTRTSSVGAAGIGTGSFSVNGSTVTVAASDTVQGVLDKIHSVSGGAISASWTAKTGGGAQIVLQSTLEPEIKDDTSGFLSMLKLDASGGVTDQHQVSGTHEGG